MTRQTKSSKVYTHSFTLNLQPIWIKGREHSGTSISKADRKLWGTQGKGT